MEHLGLELASIRDAGALGSDLPPLYHDIDYPGQTFLRMCHLPEVEGWAESHDVKNVNTVSVAWGSILKWIHSGTLE